MNTIPLSFLCLFLFFNVSSQRDTIFEFSDTVFTIGQIHYLPDSLLKDGMSFEVDSSFNIPFLDSLASFLIDNDSLEFRFHNGVLTDSKQSEALLQIKLMISHDKMAAYLKMQG